MLILVSSISVFFLVKFYNSKLEIQSNTASEIDNANESNYTFEQDWWLKPQTYSYNSELENFIAQGYSTVWWGLGLTSPEIIRTQIKDEIELYHAQGIKYIVPISLIDIEDQSNSSILNQINIDMMEAVVNKLNGDPLTLIVGFAGDPDLIQYAYDINHPKWRQYVLEQAKAAVDAGADGINLDDISGNRQWVEMGLGSFNSTSETGFRNYLKEKYSTNELNNIGINDIENFNYSDFLIRNGWTVETLSHNEYPYHGDFPLYEDFFDFQSKATAEFASLIIKTIKQYAQERYSRNIIFTECCEYRDSTAKYMSQNFNILTAGGMYGKSRTYQHIVAYKLGVAANNGLPMIAWLGDTKAHFIQQETNYLNHIYIAESYANKAQLVGHSEAKETKKYNDFILNQPDLDNFSNWKSKSKIGLLYSLTTLGNEEFYGSTHSLFFNIGQILTDCQYQFDVIYSYGDDLLANKLHQYEILILPQINLLTDEETEVLTSYITNGGKILYIGNNLPFKKQDLTKGVIDSNTKWLEILDLYGQHIQYQATSNLSKAFPEFFQLLPERPVSMNLVQTRNNFQNLVDNYLNERMIEKIDEEKLGVVLWQNKNKLILHLVNYDFNYSTKVINEKNNLKITMDADTLPNLTKVRIYSPDFSEESIPFNIEGKFLIFNVPTLRVWNIIVIE